jgi:CheY-like chemotaxis protein
MTADQVRKLGDEYARFNMEANRKTEGTGLGMNITMNLVRIMNGNLSIESTPGMGSTFTVRLPQKRLDMETIGKELADNLMQLNLSNISRIRTVQIKREFMPYGRVLVVDDVETNLYVARGLLAPYGLSIDTAMSGFDAVDRIRDGSVYDIIFMDHMMPKMDGIEATKLIRSLGYKAPVVALTANALAGQIDMFLNNGFDDFISKPIDIRQLNASLNKFIRDKQNPEVVDAAREQKNKLFANGHHSLTDQLAEIFIRDAKKSAAILEAIYINKCRRSDDISMFVINIHAMKSALANIGETSLSGAAAKLEAAGREQNMKVIMTEIPSFLELLYGVIHKLEAKSLEREKGAEEITDSDLQQLKEKLLEIQAACTAYNKKTAKDLLTELMKYYWPPEIKELLSKISECLLHSDFDEAAALIAGFTDEPDKS